MKLTRSLALTVVCVLALGHAAAAQTPPAAPPAPPGQVATPPDLPAPPPGPLQTDDFERITYARPVVRVGTPFTLGPNSAVREVTVIMADATIAGRVLGDVVVVLGNLRLEDTAIVEGSVVVVGGHSTVAQKAVIQRDLVIVGGGLDAPVDFVPRGDHVLVGPPALGAAMRDLAPWFTRGLFWGRVIVPDLGWVWAVVGVVLLINLGIAAAFPRAVHASVETLSTRPIGSLFAGVLTLLLFGPVVTILAVSVVGIIVIPFLCCAVIIGWMLGKTAVACWIGRGVMRQDDPESRAETIRSLAIGFVLIVVAYMIPILGLAAWASVGVLGLGSATLTLMAGLKRERPLPPAAPVTPAGPPSPPPTDVPPTPAPVSYMSASGAAIADQPGPYVPPAALPLSAAVPPFHTAPPPAGAAALDLTAFPRSTFLERLGAAALDVIVVGIAYNLFDWWDDDFRAFLVLLVAYHIVFWTLKGTTVGGLIFNLRVVRTDGAPLAPADATIRGLTGLLSFFALGLGFIWILRDPERQAWHDRVAGTYVVTVPRNISLR